MTSAVIGAPVIVSDASFEINTLGVGDWSTNLSPDWEEPGGPGAGTAFEEWISGFSAEGTDHLAIVDGAEVWQDTAATYQANTRYKLTVGVGHRAGNTTGGNQSTYALADSAGIVYATGNFNASTIPVGTFVDAPELVFETPEAVGSVGKTIRVLLQARGGGRSHFDWVRLEEEVIAPDFTADVVNLSANDVTAQGATLRGQVTDIGVDAPAITIFYGDEAGGADPSSWDHSVELAGVQSGIFGVSVAGLAAGTVYYSAVRATNSAGESWAFPPTNFSTLNRQARVENLPPTMVAATTATVGALVTETGGDPPSLTIYYGDNDGGAVSGNWDSQQALGVVASSATTTLTGLSGGTVYYYRVFALNSVGGAWALTSGTFTTGMITPAVVENRLANGVNGTSANLRGEVVDTGLDMPLVTIFYGTTDGGATESWDSSVVVGGEAGTFSQFVGGLSPLTTYYYTARAENGAGAVWASPSESFTTTADVPSDVVINEIHYDPEPKTELVEYVELYNAGASIVSLSGWRFAEGVSFTFPAGTFIEPGGYLVISANPADFAAKYGFTPLGPWVGSLDNDGETLQLVDAGNGLEDEVDYGVGFPWPTGALDSGRSIELIHPGLDNDLGGHWRAGGLSPGGSGGLIPAESEWLYFKGTREPSPVTGAWRQRSFDDSDWAVGTGTIGYGEGFLNTVLTDMAGGYSTVYLRKEFTIANPATISDLLLRARYDDGINVWINGTRVAWDHVSAEDLPYTATAQAADENTSYREFLLSNPQAYLLSGVNVLAVQVLNNALSGSTDAFWDAELLQSPGGTGQSPGGLNGSFSTTVPPAIRQVKHFPEEPTSIDPVVVTAKISDGDGMGAVDLHYQVVQPGAYIRLSDPAYGNPSNWVTIPMTDDGAGGDEFAGDGIYSATVPAVVNVHRRLIRYRIEAADALDNAVLVPYEDDPQPNFAYFVYDGNPGWTGSLQGGASETFSGELLDSVETYHLITRRLDHEASQYIPNSTAGAYAGSDYLWEGALVSRGRVYDHIRYRARGGGWRYSMGKNMWKFKFHDSHGFTAHDNYGRKYPEKWRRLNFSAIISQGLSGGRGEQGLYEGVGFRLFEMAGVEAPRTHYVQFRIVESALEVGVSQYRGDFQGLYLAVEQPDGRFLKAHGLPDSNIYKMENGTGEGGIGGELKFQAGPELPDDYSDLASFKSTYESGIQPESWLQENLDLTRYYSYRTIVDAIHHYDIAYGKNYYYFHNGQTGKWQVHPWDLDLTWFDGAFGSGEEPFKAQVLSKPNLDREFQNRLRSLLDLLYNSDQASRLIEEQMGLVYEEGQPSLVQADRYMWDYNPIMASAYVNSGQAGQGKFYLSAVAPGGFEGMAQRMKDYVVSRGSWMSNTYLDLPVPSAPTISYTGEAGFPVTAISLQTSAFDAVGMAADQIEWRIGEIYDPVNTPGRYMAKTPYIYEIDPVWEMGGAWSGGADEQVVPGSVLVPGHRYRARVRHRASNGRWSSWSAPLEFTAGMADVSQFQNGLVVSELMYHPRDADAGEIALGFEDSDFEFIELFNAGPVTLDLSAVLFTDGIEFSFAGAAVTVLAPGERVLVVRNIAAFESRYGPGLPVAGEYGPATGTNFSNTGELVELSLGLGDPILWFTYDDLDPWPVEADDGGVGVSLVLREPGSVPAHDDWTNWRAGTIAGGTPGAEDLFGFDLWLSGFGLSGNPEDDLDGDGVPLLLEYVLKGGSPLVLDSSILPRASEEVLDVGLGSQRFVVLEVAIRNGLDDVALNPETSVDLQAWSSPGGMVLHELLDQGDGTSLLRYRTAGEVGLAPGNLFIRLEAELVGP